MFTFHNYPVQMTYFSIHFNRIAGQSFHECPLEIGASSAKSNTFLAGMIVDCGNQYSGCLLYYYIIIESSLNETSPCQYMVKLNSCMHTSKTLVYATI